MSERETAIVAEIETQRAMLATRAAHLAGDVAELRAALVAMKAEVDAQKKRADEAEAKVAELTPEDLAVGGSGTGYSSASAALLSVDGLPLADPDGTIRG